jgi:hypothetical protein
VNASCPIRLRPRRPSKSCARSDLLLAGGNPAIAPEGIFRASARPLRAVHALGWRYQVLLWRSAGVSRKLIISAGRTYLEGPIFLHRPVVDPSTGLNGQIESDTMGRGCLRFRVNMGRIRRVINQGLVWIVNLASSVNHRSRQRHVDKAFVLVLQGSAIALSSRLPDCLFKYRLSAIASIRSMSFPLNVIRPRISQQPAQLSLQKTSIVQSRETPLGGTGTGDAGRMTCRRDLVPQGVRVERGLECRRYIVLRWRCDRLVRRGRRRGADIL